MTPRRPARPGATEAAIARGVTALRRAGVDHGDRVVRQLGQDLASVGVLAAACLEGVVAAAVVPWPGTDLDGDDLREQLRPHLRRAELPGAVTVAAELPRTATGKVRRVDLGATLGAPTAPGGRP